MTSPVMQALAIVRMQEASTFGKWCIQKGFRPLPAAPAHVAAFIRDCEPLIPIEKIWEAVFEVSQSHLSNGFADPTAGGVVAAAMNSISKINPPRSWPKVHWSRFLDLPFDLQVYLAKRDREQEREVRRAHNEAATARQKLEAIQQIPEASNGSIELQSAAA